MKKILGLLVIFVSVISGCSCKKEEVIKTSIFSSYIKGYKDKESSNYVIVEPFGTYISFIGYNEKKVNSLQEKLNEMVVKYHSLLDRNYYYKDSEGNFINNIKVINDSYGSGEAIKVDSIIIEVLKKGINSSKLSNGKFNIVAGSIVDVWDQRFDFTDKWHIDPSEEEVSEAMKCVPSINQIDEVIVIDEVNETVKFNAFNGCEGGASITLGALAKSYFLDKLSSLDEFEKVGSSIYDAGQSSIIMRGNNPVRESGEWVIAIRDSLNGGISLQVSLNGGGAVSTSSGDEKGYVNSDGVKRHHIIDATRGYPNTYLLAATLIGDSAMEVDIATTTLLTLNSMDEIKDYLAELEQNGISLKILLQKEEDGILKVLVNDAMKDLVKDVSSEEVDVNIEVFNYGA